MSDNTELAEALEQIDIESWLDDQGIVYKQARGARGRQANVKECPCCGNSNWKVYIGLETGLGNCFAGDCEAKFNKWSFIKASLNAPHNRDVIDHIKQFAKQQGWRPAKKTAVAVNMDTLKLPESIALPHSGRNLKYLDNRNITGRIASYFNLRFCQKGKFWYTDDDGRRRSQDYSNRVIIPVFDLEGDLVTFQGRDITDESEKKYLFPPGFASTGSVIYNGQNAIGAKRACIGEGVFDVAATKIALDGDMHLRDVVPIGSFGKHLSNGDDKSQMARLMELREKGLEEVTFMWDGEDKAIDAAIEAALMVKSHGIRARVAILPKDRDPNEVAPSVVRDAFWRATVINPKTATRMRLTHGR
ncbi:DNA primase [Paraburkholderia sp.]|uniref:DNA primase n=1 Tax=Paraburkholderia sp. TaxID=1926495 RepID=UPI0039E4375C